MLLLGLDIGSTACKCAAYYENGGLICMMNREYPLPAGVSAVDAMILRDSAMDAAASVASEASGKTGR